MHKLGITMRTFCNLLKFSLALCRHLLNAEPIQFTDGHTKN